MLLLAAPFALAYETDQLTGRESPPPDITALADAWVDDGLAVAIARTNAATGCAKDVAATRRVLAAEINDELARPEYVRGRALAGFGHVAYAARLETEAPHRSFQDRSDIYGDLTPAESLVLGTVGAASTVQIAGQLMGTDKPDHFFSLGYTYALVSNWGAARDVALRYGVLTEETFYGDLTSNVFSYADLAANAAGFRFYTGLLEPGSALAQDKRGCVVQVRPFRWEEWVTPAWDEVLNPSAPEPAVASAVRGHLLTHRDAYCATWAETREVDEPRRAAVLAGRGDYVVGRTPLSSGLLDLAWLCGPVADAASER